MATKMRLQRFGKKGQAYFHIVIADGRAPRDGRFIEKIGVTILLPGRLIFSLILTVPCTG